MGMNQVSQAGALGFQPQGSGGCAPAFIAVVDPSDSGFRSCFLITVIRCMFHLDNDYYTSHSVSSKNSTP